MKISYPIFRYLSVLLIINILLPACSSLKSPSKPPVDLKRYGQMPDPKALVVFLKNKNNAIKSFKGIGKVKLRNEGRLHTARMAWSGSQTNKLRIEILGVSGQPMISLANDGQWVYLFLHARQRFYKNESDKANLEGLVSVPMDSNDAIALLTGRVPLVKHHTAEVKEDVSGYVLQLKKRWWGESEKIYFDKNQRDVQKFEIFDHEDTLLYRAMFKGVRKIRGFQIPRKLVISNHEGILFQLDFDRYWINVPVSPSLFVLTPPEKLDSAK